MHSLLEENARLRRLLAQLQHHLTKTRLIQRNAAPVFRAEPLRFGGPHEQSWRAHRRRDLADARIIIYTNPVWAAGETRGSGP